LHPAIHDEGGTVALDQALLARLSLLFAIDPATPGG